jgi:hypothetical protein
MIHDRRILFVVVLCILSNAYLQGQHAVTTTGGTATGSGGTVTYSIGQITYQTYTGSSGSIAQGVQQPWEVSTPVAIENTEDISLIMNIYPNPTSGSFKLIVGSLENRNLRFRLYNMNGLLLQDKKIKSEETEILIQDLSSSLYFLKVIDSNQEVKVFKIVKR